jgi:hypothetical protein
MSALDSVDQQYRLPRTVRPVRYDLSFSVDPDTCSAGHPQIK